MKTISAFTEAAIDNPHVDVIRLVEITIGSITLYLCDRVFGDDDLCVFNGQLYEPLIVSWQDIQMGKINPETYEPEPGSAGFSIDNSQPVGGVNMFSELFAANDPQYCPVLISEIHAGASIADDKEDVFKGGIEDLPTMTVDLVGILCTGYELTVANKFIHTIVDDTTYPGADPDDLGKMVPQIYGTVERSPCIAADVGGITILTETMSNTYPSNGLYLNVSDGRRFPSSGAFTIQIDDEQIRIASRSGNVFTLAATGARGYSDTTAVPHSIGANVIEIQSVYIYLIADHPVYAIDTLYVDEIQQKIGLRADSYTILLLHCDGTDASTIFIDAAAEEHIHTVTANADAQVDTAQKVFGTASALFDGTGDYLSIPSNDQSFIAGESDFDFGDSNDPDFTIDFRIRFNTYASKTSGIFNAGIDGNARYSFMYYHNGSSGRLRLYNQMVTLLDVAWISNPSGWYHMCVTRSGGRIHLLVDGVRIGYVLTTEDLWSNHEDFDIGRSLPTNPYSAYVYLDGWIDEFRISKGIARWDPTSSFTPPTVEYPYEGGDGAGGASAVKIILYTGQSGDEYAGYSGKAVAIFTVMPSYQRQINLSISDIGHKHGTGASGNAVIEISGNSTAETVIGKVISIDGRGNLDDGSGTYTGTPSALIERPDHISKHVIIARCGLTASEIDATSYADAGTYFNTHSYVLGFSILERPNVRRLLHRIASQAKAMQFWGAGQHHMVPLEASPVMDKAIDDYRIDLDQIHLKYTDRVNIKNKFTARYSRQWSGHNEEIEADRAIVIASDAASIAIFGTLQGDSESYPYIAGATQAQAVLDLKLSDLKAPRLIIGLAGGYYLSDIERGDTIRFDNTETISESLTTGYLMTLAGDNLATLSGDKLIWWLSEATVADEFLKKALISLVTMGTTLFRVIDKTYRPDSTIQLEAVTV